MAYPEKHYDVVETAKDLPQYSVENTDQILARQSDGKIGYVLVSDLQTTLDGDGLATDADVTDLSNRINAVSASIGVSGSYSTQDKFFSTNNGNGTNYKVGDDIWIGDRNVSNTMVISGVQDPTAASIQFGSGSQPSISHLVAGASFPAVGSPQAITGSILLGHNGHMYFYNGGVSNNGWSQVI